MKPNLSYTIWFSQRTGSTLLCKALESTGIAGIPNEWLYNPDGQKLLSYYNQNNYGDLQAHLWRLGSTPNGVFGVKSGMYEPYLSHILDMLRQFPGCPQVVYPRATIWHHAWPNGRHIFMTRRNKVRLAVSWWKAIQTQEWHREERTGVTTPDLSKTYSFEAIDHLFNECSMREAGIQAFFSEARIAPLTIVYEDFIQAYEETIRQILRFLELDTDVVEVSLPNYTKLADEISEEWVQRYRKEKQRGWSNQGW